MNALRNLKLVVAIAIAVLAVPAPDRVAADGDPPAPPASPPPAARTARHASGTVDEDIVYAELEGGRKLHLDLYRPRHEGPRPTIVWIHGGSWLGGNKRPAPRGLVGRLLERGYAVAAVEYRFSNEAPFPAQIHDVKRAVRFLRRHAAALRVDPDRLASWGFSAGGHLSLLLGMTDGDDGLEPPPDGGPEVSTRVRAAASWVGPTDLRLYPPAADGPIQKLMGGKPQGEAPDLYRLGSPVAHATADDPPAFLVYGKLDWLVPFEQATAIQAALDRAGVSNVALWVDNMGHGNQMPLMPPMKPTKDEVEAAFFRFLESAFRRAPVLKYRE